MSPSSLWTLLRLLGILPLCPSPILSASRLAHRQVYKRTYAKSSFARECLGEFCQYLCKCQPLFRTGGNDSTFCRPPTANQLKRYLDQIPEDFEMSFNRDYQGYSQWGWVIQLGIKSLNIRKKGATKKDFPEAVPWVDRTIGVHHDRLDFFRLDLFFAEESNGLDRRDRHWARHDHKMAKNAKT